MASFRLEDAVSCESCLLKAKGEFTGRYLDCKDCGSPHPLHSTARFDCCDHCTRLYCKHFANRVRGPNGYITICKECYEKTRLLDPLQVICTTCSQSFITTAKDTTICCQCYNTSLLHFLPKIVTN